MNNFEAIWKNIVLATILEFRMSRNRTDPYASYANFWEFLFGTEKFVWTYTIEASVLELIFQILIWQPTWKLADCKKAPIPGELQPQTFLFYEL